MAETVLPKLRVSREEARQKIEERIEEGDQLYDQEINSEDKLDQVIMESEQWSIYNRQLLVKLFDKPALTEYTDFDYGILSDDEINHERPPSRWKDDIDEYRINMAQSIYSLEGIRDRLELYDELSETSQRTSGNKGISDHSTPTFGNEVFIVHGHNNEAKITVARFVENLGIESTILDEEVNEGQTIPEKFEEHASEAGFAIILLTPDDVGASQDERDNPKPRARQNVVLELGYFWGEG